ncbi:hypothetical protein EYF80_045875 [Liparis tanakae]|uniref:Uncharacterized protein n=1 Tax=Liparis tanakae TaxID=230148 RepID=A0A4Z2FS03_9TELE|nr:hypothetical protein EYF80_045875 [Liparis tanakae]
MDLLEFLMSKCKTRSAIVLLAGVGPSQAALRRTGSSCRCPGGATLLPAPLACLYSPVKLWKRAPPPPPPPPPQQQREPGAARRTPRAALKAQRPAAPSLCRHSPGVVGSPGGREKRPQRRGSARRVGAQQEAPRLFLRKQYHVVA